MQVRLVSLVALLALAAGTRADGPDQAKARRTVAIFVHDGVEHLEFAGPGEVFARARY